MNKTFNIRHGFLICFLLVVITLASYWQVQNHEFINLDDHIYVAKNRHIQAGLTLKGVVWALSATDISYWHPMTWLSLMLDCELYGLNPSGYHSTNLLLHMVTILLLFMVLKRMTGALWPSAFVAGLFALHPLNVESVAWVAERKNVLSTFFWVLTMWTYTFYTERPTLNMYLLVLLCFVLGLMAKPMLVTLPFILLLLDFWPLDRLHLGQSAKKIVSPTGRFMNADYQRLSAPRLILEKVPLFLLTSISIYISSLSVQRSGIVVSPKLVSIWLRTANALVSYVSYIGKMIWPHNLAVFYPMPHSVPMWQSVSAALFLVFVSALVIRSAKQRPYLAVGWFWYVGTLLPVAGLIRAGQWPAMADRFVYIPLIGIFIMFAWGIPAVLSRYRYRRILLATSAVAVLLALAFCTRLQVRHWHNSITLFEAALKVTTNNYLIHNNLGLALARQERSQEAINHYSKALRIEPNLAEAYNNIGVELAKQGELERAIHHFSMALQIKPLFAEANYNLGTQLARQGKLAQAISYFSKALQISPNYTDAHYNLGVALAKQGNFKQAISHYSKVLQINPNDTEARYNLGVTLVRFGRLDEAIQHLSKALEIKPDYAEARHNLELILRMKENPDMRSEPMKGL